MKRNDLILACVNGAIRDAREAMISPLDRSFLYGDSVYEVWRTYGGRIFAIDEHWERLEGTAGGLGFELPWSKSFLLERMAETVSEWRESCGDGETDVYIRLQLSRGSGSIGLDPELAEEPVYVILVKALPDLSDASLDCGCKLAIPAGGRRNSLKSLSPALKTGNYLNNILGLREARAAGADDALFLNLEGRLTEASTRNFWLVREDAVVTPVLEDGILAGVTRKILLERIREIDGLPLRAESLELGELERASECFLSSSTQDIQPVASVDRRPFRLGPDTVARRLKKRFREYALGS